MGKNQFILLILQDFYPFSYDSSEPSTSIVN
jgi:hypothetical protein